MRMSGNGYADELRRLKALTALLSDSHEQLTTTNDRACTTNMRVECDFTESSDSQDECDVVATMCVYVNDGEIATYLFRRKDQVKISITNAYKSDKFMTMSIRGMKANNIYLIELLCSHADRYAIYIYSEDDYAKIPHIGLIRKDYALKIINRLLNDCDIDFVVAIS